VENFERPYEAVASFYRRLAHPVLTDLEIEWGDLDVEDVVPARIPDLFTGQPVVVYGRLRGAKSGTATLVGHAGDKRVEIPIRIDVAEARRTEGLASMWARRRIQELEDTLIAAPGRAPQVEAAVTELALEFSVMSKYTSFVAIDKGEVVSPGGDPTRVDVATDLPEGMSHAAPGVTVAYDDDGDADAGESEPMYASRPASGRRMGGVAADSAVRRKDARRQRRSEHDVVQRRLESAAKRARRGLDKCFAKGTVSGPLRVEVEVDADGSIASVHVVAAPDAVASCLEDAIGQWTIRSAGVYRIAVELELDPPRRQR
jgi:Ca-activated chloride channel family protein